MSLITTAGLWNSEEIDNIENKKTTRRVSSQPQTQQIKEEPEEKIQPQMFGPQSYPETNSNMNTILSKINDINIKNAGDNLMKFNPITPPQIQNKNDSDNNKTPKINNISPPIRKIYNTQNLGDSYSNYKTSYPSISTHTPLTKNDKGDSLEGFTTHQNGENPKSGNNLMEKINYAIHLLEEQQLQKTNHIMEEFILYVFVGVFVIFLVDSFNRSVKYTR